MLRYVTIGVNDQDRAIAFYDAVMATLGHKRFHRDHESAAYGPGGRDEPPTVWLLKPFDQKPATAGNGTMIALAARSHAEVDAFHVAAMAHGGRNEGNPGLRPHYAPDWYAAYVRDPDGNKLAIVARDH